jgi:hypothetical protein
MHIVNLVTQLEKSSAARAGPGLRWNREGGMNCEVPWISITAGDSVDYEISPEDRRRYKRCRRQWDFASSHRQNLEPVESDESDWLTTAFRDALAVYYYPGTWDWQHELKQSLVPGGPHLCDRLGRLLR